MKKTKKINRSNLFTKWTGNIRNNVRDPFPKKAAFMALGALMYPVLPWAMKGLFKVNMDGWKGVVVGAAAPTLIGLATNHPEMAYAGLGCAVTHLTYGLGTGALQNVFGTPPPMFNGPTTSALKTAPVAPALPATPQAPAAPALNDAPANSYLDASFNTPGLPRGMQYVTAANGQKQLATVPVQQNTLLTEAPEGFKWINLLNGEAILVPIEVEPQLNDYMTPEQVVEAGKPTQLVEVNANALADEKKIDFRTLQQLVARGRYGR